ncbi:MAG: choline dehydrogenase [Alphaproteobacteria bacterium]
MAEPSITANADIAADFIIVGAGSAGCALAARLSEDRRNTVLVLEHGGSDAGPLIQMPAAFSIPMNLKAYDWGFQSQPESHLGGRRLAVPRGKVLGGSSSINGMVYVRGHPQDHDGWAQSGARGWAYRDVLPYYRRMEHAHGGEAGWRGTDGPLHITRGTGKNPLYRAFVRAGVEAGYAETPDYNGARQEGVGALEMTVWKGRRWSAANAYLKPAAKRPNVQIMTRCRVDRIAFEGARAIGVHVHHRGRTKFLRAGREIILSASAINSPALLMVSGVGPGDHLGDLGIPVIADRSGVGGNLQDHLELYVQHACTQPVSLNGHLGLLSRARIGLRWLATGTGYGATNHFEAGGFIRSAAGIAYPDLQIHFLPAAMRYDGKTSATGHGYQMHIGPMRSKSRGTIRLGGPPAADGAPAAPPTIRFNYMNHDEDWSEFRAAIRLAREIFGKSAFDPFRGDELAPGDAIQSDAAMDDFIRDNAESAYHPCGTCKMGDANDPDAVVDPLCQVIDVDGLRVVDSSIFPTITNGNLNAPAIMVGEKAADHILGKSPLEPDCRKPWTQPHWQTSQR